MKLFQQGMVLFLSWWLVLAGVQDGYAQSLQQSTQQLQQLVAPIALYPDGLVAQILAAASYPDQVVKAETWLEKHKNLTGDKLAKEVNKQHWDASVKALTQFPAVLANMNRNLAWTSELGDAYVNQQQAVTQAIQTMRQKALQAGNLNTTPQEKAFIAYPAEYRSSGVKTFIVTDKDVIDERDLGANTGARPSTMPADYKGGRDVADEKEKSYKNVPHFGDEQLERQEKTMAKVLCVLYDDPITGYPPKYARKDIPKIEVYPGGQTTPSPKHIDFTPGELLG